MRLRLIHDRVLVRLDPLKDSSLTGAIQLPYIAQDKQTTGVVLAVGPGFTDDEGIFHPTTLKPGQRVVFGIRPGHDFSIDGLPHCFMREHTSPSRYPNEGLLAVEEPAA